MTGPFSHLFGRRRSTHLLAIDAGSSSAVRSLFFEDSPRGRIIIEKRVFALPERGSGAEMVSPIIEHLRVLLARSVRRVGQVPAEALVGLGNHFTRSEILVGRRVRERPGSAIQEPELGEMLSVLLHKRGAATIDGSAYCLASVSPLRVAIDGYPADRLTRETRGREIELTVFATYALARFWESFLELRDLWQGLRLTSVSNQAALAGALIAELGTSEVLIVKIGSKITELTLVRDGSIRSTAQFALGGDAVTEAVAERMGLDRGNAERIKRQWGHLALPGGARRAAGEAIQGAVRAWFEALIGALGREQYAVPARVVLAGGGARLAALREALASQPWHRGLADAERMDIRVLDAAGIARPFFPAAGTALAGPEEAALAAIAYRLT